MTQVSSSNTRIAKNSVFLTLRMFIVLIISLYTTRVVLKTLGVIDYGVYNVVCGFVAMFAFLNTSMTNGIQRFYNFSLGNKNGFSVTDVYNTALRIQLLLAIFVLVLIEAVGLWYINNKMVIPSDRVLSANWIFQFAIVSFLFVVMQAPYSAAIMSRERMDYYAFVSVLDAVLKLVIAFSISWFHDNRLIVYGALIMCISILNFCLYFVYAIKSFSELKLRKTKNKPLFKSMLSFSGWNMFGSFSGIMKEQGINLILNLFFGPVVNAARGVAHQVNGGLKSLVFNLSTAFRPQIIQSYASGNSNRTMKLTYSISKISIGVLYMAALPIVLEINYILDIWLDHVVPQHTSSFVCVVLLITFVDSLNAAVSGVIHATGKMMVYQLVSSGISLLCLPAAYIALKLGAVPEAAYLWTFIFAAISQFASLIILKTLVDYSIFDYCKKILLPFIVFVVLTAWIPYILHFYMREGVLRLIVVGIVSLIVTIPVFYFVVLNKGEKTMINKLVKSLFRKIRK